MIETDYTSMLNVAYEIEGLLVLLSQRDDDRAESIRRLAVEKTDLLRSMLTAENPLSPVAETHAESPAPAPLHPVEPQEPTIKEAAPQESAPQTAYSGETVSSGAKILSKELPATASKERAPEARATNADSEPQRKPLAFTLNDKFRFRRELFGNNDIEFADAVNVISAMNNLPEAEDYLYNDLCWDSSNEDVQAFMAILTEYFK